MSNNYDNIAANYDWLSRLIFRRSQVNAQLNLFDQVQPNSTILIAGGGTGWILEALSAIHSSGLHVTYVEISAKMIALSQKRNYQQNKVAFLHQPIETYTTTQTFDTVITPFLFDNFSADKAAEVFTLLHKILRPKGNWLFTDFVYNKHSKLWQRLLLKSMYLFFKIVCRIEASSLPDMQQHFSNHHYTPVKTSFHYSGFIQSVAYVKA